MIERFSLKSRNPQAVRMKCLTWHMFISPANKPILSAARKSDEMLEPYDGKLSRTVLRRESGSNPADLVDHGHTHSSDEFYTAELCFEVEIVKSLYAAGKLDIIKQIALDIDNRVSFHGIGNESHQRPI